MSALSCTSYFDLLCPMHLILSQQGEILHAGPTAEKLGLGTDLPGTAFLDIFRVNRPRRVDTVKDLMARSGQKLHVELRSPPGTALRAVMAPLEDEEGHLVMNLSFGISIVDAVQDFFLSHADFAVTDFAIEMLYLIEAKSAVMEESRRLNLRLQGAKVAAEHEADTDMLTGLKNRRALNRVLAGLVEKPVSFAVMQIDLDNFKTVNDSFGHAAGDAVLCAAAQIMVEETREGDTVARAGGDEFFVVLPDIRNDETLRRVGRRLIDRLEEPIPYQEHTCRISASIGTVWVRSDPTTMERVMDDSDLALYASKRAGRARQTLYDPSLRSATGRLMPPPFRG